MVIGRFNAKDSRRLPLYVYANKLVLVSRDRIVCLTYPRNSYNCNVHVQKEMFYSGYPRNYKFINQMTHKPRLLTHPTSLDCVGMLLVATVESGDRWTSLVCFKLSVKI